MSGQYDQLFKVLAEGDPLGLLRLCGALPAGVEAKIEPIGRELTVPLVSVDCAFKVRRDEQEWVVHIEAQTHYPSNMGRRLSRYGMLLAMAYELPVQTYLLLLLRRNCPEVVPEQYSTKFGCLSVSMGYRVVRLWEVDARSALEMERASLLPWVPLMQASEGDVVEAAQRIAHAGDEDLALHFVVLGGLRYDRGDLELILRRAGSMLTLEDLKESSGYQMLFEMAVKEGREEGLQKGQQEGRQEGRQEEARQLVRRVIALRFPELGSLPELDAITDASRLEALHDEAVLAKDASQVLAAIRRS